MEHNGANAIIVFPKLPKIHFLIQVKLGHGMNMELARFSILNPTMYDSNIYFKHIILLSSRIKEKNKP